MRIAVTKRLFVRDCQKEHPSLSTLRDFWESVPAGKLLPSLRAHRGRDRDDYLLHVLLGTVPLTIAHIADSASENHGAGAS